jgi:hypothetical protein
VYERSPTNNFAEALLLYRTYIKSRSALKE